MEFPAVFLVGYLMLSSLGATCYGVTFSSLNKTLIVSASSPNGHVLKAGEDELTITWEFNKTFSPGTDSTYKTIKLNLCYAPVSQKDRPWRKTVDNLTKDKSCPHEITTRPYTPSNNSITWRVQREIPSATFFVRAYALDGQEVIVGYGQNTDKNKTLDLFTVDGITGRHVSIDVASVCFTVFSVGSLVGFFYTERRKGKLLSTSEVRNIRDNSIYR